MYKARAIEKPSPPVQGNTENAPVIAGPARKSSKQQGANHSGQLSGGEDIKGRSPSGVSFPSSKSNTRTTNNFYLDHSARTKRIARLRRELDGESPFAEAFRKLLDAKCERKFLESVVLHDWYLQPWQQAKALLGREGMQDIATIARTLEKQARKLAPNVPLLAGRAFLESGIAAEHITLACSRLTNLAEALRLVCTITAQQKRSATAFTASRRIPYVIQQLREMTGRPHFEELATLYERTYERSVTADDLKSIEVREKRRMARKK